MLARTEIRGIVDDARMPEFLESLRRYALVILPTDFLRMKLNEWPPRPRQIFLEYLKSNKLAYRYDEEGVLGETGDLPRWHNSQPLPIQIIVGEGIPHGPMVCERVEQAGYGSSWTLRRLKDLIEGEENVSSRDDFWIRVCEPLLHALRPESKQWITICDNYLFHHIERLGSRNVDLGFPWFLQRIAASSPKARIRLVVAYKNLSEERKIEAIANLRNLFRQIDGVDAELLESSPDSLPPALGAALHQRFILFGNMRGVTVDSGFDSLSMYLSSVQYATLQPAWSYKRELGDMKNPMLQDFAKAARRHSLKV